MGYGPTRVDSRGRIRFTHNHVRYEINRLGELRTYVRRGNTERSDRPIGVNIDCNRLQRAGRRMLHAALYTHMSRTLERNSR